MKIGIIGAGSVGSVLGRRWNQLDHQVRFGVRDPGGEKARALGERAAAPVADAAAFGDIVVLATPWKATQEAIGACGDLSGKTIIDCTNPWVYGEGLQVGFDTSGAELVAQWAPGAHVFKAMNQASTEVMADPSFGDRKAVMFVAGDDGARKGDVLQLVEQLGFETIDAGPLRQARLLEPLAALWIDLALERGLGRQFAWALLRR